MERSQRYVYLLTILVIVGFAIVAFVVDGAAALTDCFTVQVVPARLIQDFTGTVGVGGGLLNAALVAAIGLFLVGVNRIRLSGPTVAAVFTMLGFGLFGKTVFNVIPIIFGVYLSALFAGKRFDEYILIALFGTALGPIVTAVAFEVASGLWTLPVGIAGGLVVGFFLPPAAIAMLRMHQGYSLYNIGLTSGFLGIFVAAIIRAAGPELSGVPGWDAEPAAILGVFLPTISVISLVLGIALARKAVVREFRAINRLSGRLPTDFFDIASPGTAVFNMGVMGILTWLLILAVGAPQNGPVLGAAMTIVGFAGFGKHPRNTWAPVAGVMVATLVFGYSWTDPAPLLAILFVTTLAPLSGDFGPIVGFIAGVIHLTLVLQTGSWHGGIALYNNGFAGGLTATLVLATIEWYRSTHDDTLRRWAGGK